MVTAQPNGFAVTDLIGGPTGGSAHIEAAKGFALGKPFNGIAED